jgi:lipopolysaccharide transport system permease protein
VSFAPHGALVLEPGSADRHYWRDLWAYREVLWILTWRDIKVRYKQTVIGVAWAVVRPLLTMLILTVVFGRIGRFPSEGHAPYAVMVFAGMLPWFLFSSALSEASGSIVGNAAMVGKVYFPRLLIPLAAIGGTLLDFLVSAALLVPLMAWHGYAPGWQVALLPAFVLLAIAASVGPGLWLTALNVKYRDFRYVIPFLLQIGLYVSPVGFTSAVVPAEWRLLYSLNPIVGVIDGFRWCLVGAVPYWPGFAVSCAVIALFLWLGLSRFRATERSFADMI